MTSSQRIRAEIRPFDAARDLLWVWKLACHFGQWAIPQGTAWILQQGGTRWVVPGKSFGAAFRDECGVAAIVLTAPDGIKETITLVDTALEGLEGVTLHSHHDNEGLDSWACRLLARRWGFKMKDGLFQREC